MNPYKKESAQHEGNVVGIEKLCNTSFNFFMELNVYVSIMVIVLDLFLLFEKGIIVCQAPLGASNLLNPLHDTLTLYWDKEAKTVFSQTTAFNIHYHCNLCVDLLLPSHIWTCLVPWLLITKLHNFTLA